MLQIRKLSVGLSSGLITPLHSDTIYGHFCWRLLELRGETVLRDFISRYMDGNPVFTLSDGLYEVGGEVLFPKPKHSGNNSNKNAPTSPDSKEKKIKKHLNKKADRAKRYITAKNLQAFLDGDLKTYRESVLKDLAPDLEITKDLRIHVGIDRNTFMSGDGLLFEQSPEHLDEKTGYAILLKVFDEDAFNSTFEVESILKDLCLTGFGKKKSSGYGAFEWGRIDDFALIKEPAGDCNFFYTLGNYLPSENDGIVDGYYRFFVKYGKLGETGASGPNPFKKPMIMMRQGSCFEVKKNRQFYGRLTSHSEISSNPNVVQFGIPLTLNFKVPDIGKKDGDRNESNSEGHNP